MSRGNTPDAAPSAVADVQSGAHARSAGSGRRSSPPSGSGGHWLAQPARNRFKQPRKPLRGGGSSQTAVRRRHQTGGHGRRCPAGLRPAVATQVVGIPRQSCSDAARTGRRLGGPQCRCRCSGGPARGYDRGRQSKQRRRSLPPLRLRIRRPERRQPAPDGRWWPRRSRRSRLPAPVVRPDDRRRGSPPAPASAGRRPALRSSRPSRSRQRSRSLRSQFAAVPGREEEVPLQTSQAQANGAPRQHGSLRRSPTCCCSRAEGRGPRPERLRTKLSGDLRRMVGMPLTSLNLQGCRKPRAGCAASTASDTRSNSRRLRRSRRRSQRRHRRRRTGADLSGCEQAVVVKGRQGMR